jgi:acyl-CoA synthetase (AMP-forming)/AMP-acid ligase II
MYLTQNIHRMVQQAPDRLATIDGDRAFTWSQTRDRVARFAGALRGLGLQPGDRVALLGRNGDHFYRFIFGTLWAGGVINPVNIRWTPAEIAYSLENCQTRILLVDAEFAALIPAIRARAPGLAHVLVTGSPEHEAWLAAAEPVADALRRNDDLAAILYTGGTTGFPKGVMLSHRGLTASAMGCIGMPNGRASDRYLHTAPMFHVGALSGVFIALYSDATHYFLPVFDPVAVLEIIDREKVAELFLVPTMLRMVVDHPRFAEFDITSVRRIRYGASPIDGGLMDRALVAFPNAGFHQAYGMTELSPIATVLAQEDHGPEGRANGRIRTAGRAITTAEVRIVDSEDREVPRGGVGEVVVRGPGVMLGYWNMPEATAEALRNGWMHTGDLGTMDTDGYLTVVDRLKDMIITGGENVYSAEVETALSTHPDVAQAAVIAAPDEKWGERVHAVIVARPGVTPCPDRLAAHCRQTLAGFKVPRSFDFVDALPLSGAGKVLKNELRARQRATAEGAG